MTAPAEVASAQGASPTAVVAQPDVARRRCIHPRIWVVVVCGLSALSAAAVISAASIDGDGGRDLVALGRAIAADVGRLRWQYTAAVVGLAGLHYVATAVAARAAAGVPLPLAETVLVQLGAAAANRLTPAGLGGSALTARYLTRRGLHTSSAIGAVAALAVLGAPADLLVLAIVVLAGPWLGLGGGSHEIGLLTAHVARFLAPIHTLWFWAAVVGAGATCVWVVRRRNGRIGRWSRFWLPIRGLLRRPRALATLLMASGCTTLALGFAFVATTAMVPGPQPMARLGSLLVAFLIAAATGSSVPIPSGLGSTEAALVAALLSMHVPASHAVEQVLIFRLLTFWLPAIAGVLVTRHLYRRRAL